MAEPRGVFDIRRHSSMVSGRPGGGVVVHRLKGVELWPTSLTGGERPGEFEGEKKNLVHIKVVNEMLTS